MKSNDKISGITAVPAYLRKSRAEEGESIAEVLSRHRVSLGETAKAHGIVISEYFEEVVSGESLYSRPEMLRLLEGVEAGKYDAVLCMDIDRLGRGGMRDQGIILDTFRLSDTLIITPDKIYDLTNDDDEEMTEFKAFFARREYKMIRKRMSRGLMRTITEGGYVANAPYGYKKTKIDKLPSLEIVPEEARFVEYIFNRYLEGVGSATIADEINTMGSKPNRSDRWTRNSIRGILQNPTYYGAVPWNRVRRVKKGDTPVARHLPEEDWILADGKHEPIISKEVYAQAQEVRKRRVVPSWSRFTGHIRNPMAGILKCSKCGHNMQMMGSNKGEAYILCNTKSCCAGAKESYVEAALIQSLERELQMLRLELAEQKSGSAESYDAAIASVQKAVGKAGQRRTALYDFLEDGTYSREEFVMRKEKADAAVSELNTKLEELQKKRQLAIREDKRRMVSRLEYVLSMYNFEDAAGKNRLLKSVIDFAYYTKEKKTKPNEFELVVYLRPFL